MRTIVKIYETGLILGIAIILIGLVSKLFTGAPVSRPFIEALVGIPMAILNLKLCSSYLKCHCVKTQSVAEVHNG